MDGRAGATPAPGLPTAGTSGCHSGAAPPCPARVPLGAPRGRDRDARRAPSPGQGGPREAEKVHSSPTSAPPGAAGPAGPAASRPGARSGRGAGGARSPGERPQPRAAPAAPGSHGAACTHRARWIPRGRPRRAVRPQLERELGLGGAGSQRTERSGDEEGHSRKEAAVAPADAAQPGQPHSASWLPRRRGLYRRRRAGPRPFLPPPPPARLAPPSRRLLCVAAGLSFPAPGLRDAPSPPATSRMPLPEGSLSRGCARNAPGRRADPEVQRQPGPGCTWVSRMGVCEVAGAGAYRGSYRVPETQGM